MTEAHGFVRNWGKGRISSFHKLRFVFGMPHFWRPSYGTVTFSDDDGLSGEIDSRQELSQQRAQADLAGGTICFWMCCARNHPEKNGRAVMFSAAQMCHACRVPHLPWTKGTAG